jgi:hypothetical protein
VEVRLYGSHIDLRVDDVRERLNLGSGETLPASLGTLYIAGYPSYDQLPWMVFSRESYLGCLSELRVGCIVILQIFFVCDIQRIDL